MEEVDIENYFTEIEFEQMAYNTQPECYIDETILLYCDMYFTISKN